MYGNKIDLPGALAPDEVIERMELARVSFLPIINDCSVRGEMKLIGFLPRMTQMKGRVWHYQPSCARSGAGLYEGLSWLASAPLPQ